MSKQINGRNEFNGTSLTCLICMQDKPLECFHRQTRSRSGRRPYCKECNSAQTKEWRSQNREHYQNVVHNRLYGISFEEKKRKIQELGGKCEACGSCHNGRTNADPVSGWCVDHDHATGKVRGIICFHCNVALGMLSDSEERILSLLSYLRRKR